MKTLFNFIHRKEIVAAIGIALVGAQVLQDELTKGVSWGTAVRAAAIAIGTAIARANVFSKATKAGA